MPIAYIQRTRERYAQYPPYRWVVNTEAPWTPLPRPLRECRLGGKRHDRERSKDNDQTTHDASPPPTPLPRRARSLPGKPRTAHQPNDVLRMPQLPGCGTVQLF